MARECQLAAAAAMTSRLERQSRPMFRHNFQIRFASGKAQRLSRRQGNSHQNRFAQSLSTEVSHHFASCVGCHYQFNGDPASRISPIGEREPRNPLKMRHVAGNKRSAML
jgi:hypothetical protein